MKIPSPYTPENRAEANYYKLGGYAFHRMKLYLKSMRDLMESQRFKLEKRHKKELVEYPQYPQLIDDVYKDQYRQLDVHFVRILLNSSFIASFSIFEIMFKEVCQLAAYKYSQHVNVDYSSDIIGHCRNYIVKGLRIDISEINDYWKDLMHYRELRNHLVHQNATIGNNYGATISFMKKRNHIKVKKVRNKDEYQFTITDKQFVIEFLDKASEFLANILLSLPKGKRKTLPHLKKLKSAGQSQMRGGG